MPACLITPTDSSSSITFFEVLPNIALVGIACNTKTPEPGLDSEAAHPFFRSANTAAASSESWGPALAAIFFLAWSSLILAAQALIAIRREFLRAPSGHSWPRLVPHSGQSWSAMADFASLGRNVFFIHTQSYAPGSPSYKAERSADSSSAADLDELPGFQG